MQHFYWVLFASVFFSKIFKCTQISCTHILRLKYTIRPHSLLFIRDLMSYNFWNRSPSLGHLLKRKLNLHLKRETPEHDDATKISHLRQDVSLMRQSASALEKLLFGTVGLRFQFS